MKPLIDSAFWLSAKSGAALVLVLGALSTHAGRLAAAQDTQAPAGEQHSGLTPEKISVLAHRVMEAGVKGNALAGDGLPPWHMKMDFQVIVPGDKKPVSGTMEEWHLSTKEWVRTFRSAEASLTGTEWSTSKTAQYQSKPSRVGFEHRLLLLLRVARPVLDPLYQTANIKPEYEMDVKRVTTAGVKLNCVSVLDPQRYADEANPDWLFPTMCFDSDYHLRLTSTSDTSVQFEDLQPFQDRTVARDVKVIFNGTLTAAMKITLLEPWTNADAERVKPAKDTIALPYTIEPGQPKPVSVYEVAASVPIQPNGFPFRGRFLVPITIHKDGSVKARNDDTSFWSQSLKDALASAIDRWKFKPYLVDGEPVEVAWSVVYVLDGKPFVPSYARTQPQTIPPQQDSPDNAGTGVMPRRRPH